MNALEELLQQCELSEIKWAKIRCEALGRDITLLPDHNDTYYFEEMMRFDYHEQYYETLEGIVVLYNGAWLERVQIDNDNDNYYGYHYWAKRTPPRIKDWINKQ